MEDEETTIHITLTKQDSDKLEWLIKHKEELEICLDLSKGLYAHKYNLVD